MKYLLLAYAKLADWDAMDVTSPEFQAACEFYADLTAELTATGELVTTEGLAHPSLTRTVRPGDGAPTVVDGPYAESKEVLASFAILDCASHDRVMAIAARITEAVGDAIEVRPIMAGAPGADEPGA
ncbi:hypothetical protein LX15_006085 [Streptoalloteichus tenebrarius]|uniref:YCII-related domain-containing protein n=1 Tax=Streptoalloteichus tenebrarius (strain ATCC 17920 / DSM 40477 / JCM 4838 / CBS 697.72 / NBRC 16177 / NCIMB 11028 / NRRL B-12390 / A12253. 1 / ISP 5477) TaxID=1933 RepID=A0ABT1I3H5_STRSD|nr:YciI family protein [Streptoalloteichus tenebrarius]MCP2262349.1 hypothetical protein [Streptoalloteichus tenebrarius]BFF02048.1 YciI family protein [Streptoalloteichus tenebrarius]